MNPGFTDEKFERFKVESTMREHGREILERYRQAPGPVEDRA